MNMRPHWYCQGVLLQVSSGLVLTCGEGQGQGEGQGEGEGCTRSIRWRVTRRGGRRAVAPLGGTLLLARQQAGALFGHISTWAPTDAFSIQGHEKPFCDAEVGSGFIGSGLGLGLGLGLGFGVRVRGPINLRDDPADESGHRDAAVLDLGLAVPPEPVFGLEIWLGLRLGA